MGNWRGGGRGRGEGSMGNRGDWTSTSHPMLFRDPALSIANYSSALYFVPKELELVRVEAHICSSNSSINRLLSLYFIRWIFIDLLYFNLSPKKARNSKFQFQWLLLRKEQLNNLTQYSAEGESWLFRGAGMAQWWKHPPSTNVARVRFPDSASYLSWVCGWFPFLLL